MSSTADRWRRSSVRRWWRSGASEWGKSERVRGTVRGGICSAAACERRERRALSWPGHGDGEVAAGGRFWARGTAGEAPARGKKRWRRSGAMRGAVLQAGGGRAGPPRRRRAEQRRRQEKQRGRLEVEEKETGCNFRNFRDLTVNQQSLLI